MKNQYIKNTNNSRYIIVKKSCLYKVLNLHTNFILCKIVTKNIKLNIYDTV